MIASKAKSLTEWTGAPIRDRLLALSSFIEWPSWEGLPRTNTLAYFA